MDNADVNKGLDDGNVKIKDKVGGVE